MKNKLIAGKVGIGLTMCVLAVALLANHNVEKIFHYGDYVPEENAYFVEKIEDETGLIKAHKFITPTDNQYNSQKLYSHGTNMLGDLEGTWSSYTGRGTTVAIIDDGFDYNHPEYTRSDGSHAILSTSRYYYASGNSAYYKSYSSEPSCIAEDWEEGYSGYEWATHGTNTSSTAAAPMNNGGGVGIAPEADILALKIDMSFVAIKAAIQYAVSQGVDVINMSLGAYAESFTDGWGDSQSGSYSVSTYLDSVCQSAYDAGIIVVAAAGNESTWHKSYPACNTKVIGVGALEQNDEDTLAAFTNYVGDSQTGEINVDILAPGYVYTATQSGSENNITHNWSATQGTSFSSPIVAGAACLWKQKHPNGTPDQFLSALQSSASDIGTYENKMVPVSLWDDSLSDVGPSNIVCGRLNVSNLLDINEPFVSVAQSSVNISVNETKQIDLTTYNGVISYSIADTDVATVSNSGLVRGVGAGSTTLTVTATKNAHTATVDIPVTVSSPIACNSISISPTSVTLEVGESYEIEPTISVTPANAERSFMFASNDEYIATVDFESGYLFAVAEGNTTIDIIPEYGDGEATLTVTVTTPTTPTSWDRITSVGDLEDGDYLIVYEGGNVAFDGSRDTLDAANNTIDVTINNHSITYSNATYASRFTINAIQGGYSIRSASGYYIGNDGGSNGLSSSPSNAYLNSISFSNGNATIVGAGGKTLSYNTQNNQNRFRYMAAGGLIQLYKASGAASQPISVTGVSLNKNNLSLDVGDSETLVATVSPNEATNKAVTWTSSETGVATVSGGTVTAVSAGNATITARTVDGNFTATCVVTVSNAAIAVTGVSLNKNYTTLEVGDTENLVATVAPANATNKAVTWSSSATSIATVSNGTITAVSAGNATITVRTNDGNFTATCSVTVNAAPTPPSPSGESLEITFKTGNGDGTEMSKSTSESNYLSAGSEYISSISSVSKTYYGGDYGLKLGASSAEGSLALTLESAYQVEVTSIVVNAKLYNSTKAATLSVNGKSAQSVSSSFGDLSFDINDTIEGIALTSNKYIWISGLTINLAEPENKIVDSLSASYDGPSIYVGDELDESYVTVTASYTDFESYPNEVLPSSDYSLTGFESASAGQKTITVTYIGALETSSVPLTTTFAITVLVDSLTSIAATCNKAFHPGETISKSDITVTAHWASGKTTYPNDFTFEGNGYRFLYSDTQGGSAVSAKQFTISYGGHSCSVSVSVSRAAYGPASTLPLALTGAQAQSAGITGTGAGGIANYEGLVINGVTCDATNIYVYNNSFMSFGKGAGEIHNTVALSSSIVSLSLTLGSSRIDEKLYVSMDGSNYVLASTVDLATSDYRYFKVAYETTSSNYSNISQINIGLRGSETAETLSNYLMYEDTDNQCTTKFDTAKVIFGSMSSSEKNTFMTSNDYVIATARERLEAWAANQGKRILYTNGDYAIAQSQVVYKTTFVSQGEPSEILFVFLGLIGLGAITGYAFLRRKANKE